MDTGNSSYEKPIQRTVGGLGKYEFKADFYFLKGINCAVNYVNGIHTVCDIITLTFHFYKTNGTSVFI